MFDLDTHEDEVRPVPDGEFESIQLDDNPSRLVKIGFRLPLEVRSTLIECLHINAYLFVISSHEMLNNDPNVACHWLNMDYNARHVS